MFDCRRCERTLHDEAKASGNRGRICHPCFRAERNEYRKTSEAHKRGHAAYQRKWRAMQKEGK